jgi:hypothetical protein
MKKPLLPQSELAKRICAIFHRKLTTVWDIKEVRSFRRIKDHIEEEDLQMIERRYKSCWPPREGNYLRRNLYTFLNCYASEIDSARIWCEEHPLRKPPRKVIPMPPVPSEPYGSPVRTPEEQAAYDRFMEEFQRRKQSKSA